TALLFVILPIQVSISFAKFQHPPPPQTRRPGQKILTTIRVSLPAQFEPASLMWIPATAIPPSPTAAAQRLTEPERTSPAAKIPGRLVSSGAGRRLFARHAGDSATSAPVLMNPFSSRSISEGNHSVHGRAPIIENTAGVLIIRRSPVCVFSNSTSSSF